MKKTLMTLAALAAASVASASALNFTGLSGESTHTFGTPTWSGGWDYSTGNVFTLVGATTVDSANKTISNGIATVTYTNDVQDVFRLHNGSGDVFNGPFVMSAATINFGTDGSLLIDRNAGSGINLGELGIRMSATLETVVYTDDVTKVGTSEVVTRTLIQDLDKGAMWNREGNNGAFGTLTFTTNEGDALTQATSSLTTADTSSFAIVNPNDYTVAVSYVVTYQAAPTGNVPEPTTATLSLLALAGLAARRRRK